MGLMFIDFYTVLVFTFSLLEKIKELSETPGSQYAGTAIYCFIHDVDKL